MRIRDICRNLEEPIVFKSKPCISVEAHSLFGGYSDEDIGHAFSKGYLFVETFDAHESRACSKNGECPYLNVIGRLMIINPEMTKCEEYVGEARPTSLTEGRPCSLSARP